MKTNRAYRTDPLERLVVDELIAILEDKQAHCRNCSTQDEIALLEGLEELLAHSAKGLKEVKERHLPPAKETKACRVYLKNLLGTLEHMSHTSHMANMAALQSALKDILKELMSRLDNKPHRHTKH